MNIDSKYDYSISLIRLASTTFIVACHIMQYLDIELAWWFNVGVQMFLSISGFLYGRKNTIEDDLQFYKKNIAKILIDYYVVVVTIILVFAAFLPKELSIIEVLKVLLTIDTLSGGGHLWYIPYCLFCYLITPFLCRYFDNSKNKNTVKNLLFLCVLTVVIIEGFIDYFNSAWIICYIIGFFIGRISTDRNSKLYRNVSWTIVAGAILSNAIQIVQDYVIKLELTGIVASLYQMYCDFAHVALGAALFVSLKFILSAVFKMGYPEPIKKLCFYSDKYSYDIYLVHQFLILGPLSLMKITGIYGINIMLILVVTIICAIIVNFISSSVRYKLKWIAHL